MKKYISSILTLVIILSLVTVNANAIGSAGFIDVPTDAYYSEPVLWAVENNVTNGVTATTFGPDNTCTRAQILTFLWRAVGSPTPTAENPFTDVSETQFYYSPALWAYENGMIEGSEFSGNTPCTRAEVVTYQWKLAGSPTGYTHAFTDVSADDAYDQAVAWAVAEGITNGVSATTFGPDTTCTRGQIVTFLWRDLAEKTLYRQKSVNVIVGTLKLAETGKYLSYSDRTFVLNDTPTNWEVELDRENCYSVRAKGTDLAFDIYYGWIVPGNTVELYEFNGGNNQLWKIIVNPDGTVSFLSFDDSTLCLGFENEKAILEKRKSGDKSQEFVIDYTGMAITQWCEIKSDDGVITLKLEDRVFDVISPERLVRWANDLSTAYASFAELVGSRPFETVTVQALGPLSPEMAHAHHYGTICYDNEWFLYDMGLMAAREEDWNFVLMHEMGHLFDFGKPWNFESEVLTTIKVPYVLEMNNAVASPLEFGASTVFRGMEILEAFKVYTKENPEEFNDVGIVFNLMEVQQEVGWEPFKQTFRYMEENYSSKNYTSNAQRWDDFIATLSKFSGKDVLSYFTDAEIRWILDYID